MRKLNLIRKISMFLLILLIVIVFIDKSIMEAISIDYPDFKDTNILIKYFNVKELNIFFKKITLLGEITGVGIVGFFILLISFFTNKKEEFYNLFLKYIVTFFTSGVITTVLKASIGRERPFIMWNPHHFYGGIEIFTSNIVHKDSFFSFPSGHTTAAFAIFGILYMFTKKRTYKIIFILLPILVAISRIYLGKHFLSDTLAGGAIGYFTAAFINKYNIYDIISKFNKNNK